ncbi:MAG: CHAT domain-containing protein [Thermoanaerobaculia bacterium]
MDYEDFTLLVAPGPDGPEVRVLDSPAGEGAQAPFACDVSEADLARLAEVVEWASGATPFPPRRHVRPEDAPRGDSLLRELGGRLYRGLFAGEVRVRLIQSLERAPHNLRIRLQLDLHTGGEETRPTRPAGLHRLPWELLREPGEGHLPLALRRGTPIVRYLDVEGRPELPDAPETLKVLAVAPRPSGVPPLDLERELDELRDALGRRRDVALRVLEPPTLEALVEALRGGDVHALHFLGHGELDPGTGDGALVLEDWAGGARRVPAWALVEQLADFLPRTRMVFLNACRTAEAAAGAPWAGLATSLVRAGVPAVLAMQLPVTDRAAGIFAGSVYRRLAAGDPVDRAVADGRLALRGRIPGTPEWATPALFLRVPDGRVFAPARREAEPAREERAAGAHRGRHRPLAATAWAAAGLAGLLLGGLVVVRGLDPVGRPDPVPDLGAGERAGETEGAAGEGAGAPAETVPPSRAARGSDPVERPSPETPDGSGNPGRGGNDASGPEPTGHEEPVVARDAGQGTGRTTTEDPIATRPAGSTGSASDPAGDPGPSGTAGPPASALLELAFGESVRVAELQAHVTVDPVTVQGEELIRVTVSPDGHDSAVRAGFPGSTLRFPAGEETLSVHVLSLDQGAGLVRLRARRSGV